MLSSVCRWVFRGLAHAVVLAAMAAIVLSTAGQPAQAQVTVKDLLEKSISDIPDDMAKAVTQAITLFGQNQFDDARNLLKQTRVKFPQLPPEGVLMAQMFVNVNQGMAARSELERAVLADPKDAEPYLVFGDLAFQNRMITESGLCFDKAHELVTGYNANPKRKRDLQIRAFAGLAAVASARELHKQEQGYLTKWIELEPESTAAYTRLGRAQFMEGGEEGPKAAYATFRELYDKIDKAKDPAQKVPRAEVNMAMLYTQTEKVSNARKLIDLAMQRATPEDINTRLAVAQWALENADQEGALPLAKGAAAAAAKIDPDSLQALLLAGIAARYEKDYANAEKLFRGALSKAPSNFAAMNNLALTLIDQPDEAKRRQAAEFAQLNQRIYADLATPLGREAAVTLAWVLFQQGREADAEQGLMQILRAGSISNEGAFYAAKVLNSRGRTKESKAILDPLVKQPRYFPQRDEAKTLLERTGDSGDSDLESTP